MQRYKIALRCGLLLLGLVPAAAADEPIQSSSAIDGGRTPDAVIKRLADLVHAQKYEDARTLLAGLEAAYPGDDRLTKAKALLDQSARPAPDVGHPRPADSLTGTDKLDYYALVDLVRKCQETTDLDEQKELFVRFLKESEGFVGRHPELTLLWQLRAVAALTTGNIKAGYDAGQRLIAAGALDSGDQKILALMAQLKNARYLDADHLHEYLAKLAQPDPSNPLAFDLPLSDQNSIRMLPVPPGTFLMGNDKGPSNEGPETTVTLTNVFWLGQTEITQAQYTAVTGQNPSRYKRPENPVEIVSYADAMDFCAKLTEIARKAGRLPRGYQYTLPTEAEWEYACLAGSKSKQPDNPRNVAWAEGETDEPQPVATKKPNAWGFYDMLGNVAEICRGWYAKHLPGGRVVNPAGPPTGTKHVTRGSDFWLKRSYCHPQYRFTMGADWRDSETGFRIALCQVQAGGAPK